MSSSMATSRSGIALWVRSLGGPSRLPLEEAELTDNYAFFAPPAESDKLLAVEFKVEDALCEQATGEGCGI